MLSEVFYLVRSRIDGQYLVARPRPQADVSEESPQSNSGYLLMFKEHFDALSYLNTHGADVANQFSVESMTGNQLGNLMKRWGFTGVGIVQDPLLPRIEFLRHDTNI